MTPPPCPSPAAL
uniref:Uncharacterized protein n=1 Tax=Anguilla anguilla TaxID=7936 RepID=A0A0E9SIB5_ANGAN